MSADPYFLLKILSFFLQGGFAVGIFGGMMFAPSVHATKTHRTTVWVFRMIGAGLLAAFSECMHVFCHKEVELIGTSFQ